MQSKGRILIVEDDASGRAALAEVLGDHGYEIETAADGFKTLTKIEAFAPQLILSDLRMPGLDGIGLLGKVRESGSDALVVLMTADHDVATAVSAMRQGAADYVTKPIDLEYLLVVIERELQRHRLRADSVRLRLELSEQRGVENIVGSTSAAMQPMGNAIKMVAPSRASVLITGESGTGKELVAAAIHDLSPRRTQPFIKLHCAALAETLLESELFGHERGAFTGANARREGRFEQADGGTIFLDEIGDISAGVQVKLLRFLQEREFERVGGNQTVKVDVRIIAATNRDLLKDVRDGRFREDLYYRLAVVSIPTVALRDMCSNIPAIAMHFLHQFAEENGKKVSGFSDDALDLLTRHSWPGNVRELENAVERGLVCCKGQIITATDLSLVSESKRVTGFPLIPGATIAELEKFAILKTLEHTGGSTHQAAAILGISARKLQYKVKEYMSKAPPLSADILVDVSPDAGRIKYDA